MRSCATYCELSLSNFQCLVFSTRREISGTELHTHNDYCMPRGSSHQGIIILTCTLAVKRQHFENIQLSWKKCYYYQWRNQLTLDVILDRNSTHDQMKVNQWNRVTHTQRLLYASGFLPPRHNYFDMYTSSQKATFWKHPAFLKKMLLLPMKESAYFGCDLGPKFHTRPNESNLEKE